MFKFFVIIFFIGLVIAMLTPSNGSDPGLTEKEKQVETQKLLAELKKIPVKQYAANRDRYKKLTEYHPGNQHYRDKLAFYDHKIKEQKRIGQQILDKRSKTRLAKLGQTSWHDGCTSDPAGFYCEKVGYDAYNGVGSHASIRNIRLGEIIGVSWRPKGTVIGTSPARVSPRSAFYYIIDPGAGGAFIRMAREIDPRFPKG